MDNSLFPIISSNTSSILKYRASYLTDTDRIFLKASSNSRYIILSAIVNGTYIKVGYAVDVIGDNIGTGNDILTNFTDTFAPTPIIENSVVILHDGVAVGYDDGAGFIVPAGGGEIFAATSTINYITGALNLDYNTAPASGVVIDANYSTGSFDETIIDYDPGATVGDFSNFFENAKFSMFKANKNLLLETSAAATITIAYSTFKG